MIMAHCNHLRVRAVLYEIPIVKHSNYHTLTIPVYYCNIIENEENDVDRSLIRIGPDGQEVSQMLCNAGRCEGCRKAHRANSQAANSQVTNGQALTI
jgi:hypothetical protein